MNLLCLLGRHLRDRKDVYWDGEFYRTSCTRCERQIVRVRHNVWRRAKGRQIRREADVQS